MTAITDNAIGYIIIVVAVLLSHMLNSPVESIKPSTMRSPRVPVALMILSAILLCRFHFSMAKPRTNPPKKGISLD